jgi:threonyl-tRNA synthetase
VPYFIIVGDKDIAANKVTLESRDEGQVGQKDISEILKMFEEKNQTRS